MNDGNHVAQLVWNDTVKRYMAIYNGRMLCQSTNRHRVALLIEDEEQRCRKAIQEGVTHIVDTTIVEKRK